MSTLKAQKATLFSDDEEEALDFPAPKAEGELKINQKFADKFQYQEKRKELEKLQAKYGSNPVPVEEEEVHSDSSSEDEEAVKLTDKAEDKFRQLLYRIQKQDKTLMDDEGEYFTDSDFEEEEGTKKKDKKITYKDVLRRDALKKMEEGGEADSGSDSEDAEAKKEDLFKKRSKDKETMAEEQARLKNAFKDAASSSKSKKKKSTKPDDSSSAESDGDQNYDSDEDILIKKPKGSDSESESNSDNSDDQKIRKDKKKHTALPFQNDDDVLAQVYGEADGNLDRTDLFLRQYVLNEGWKDKGKGESKEEQYDHYKTYQQQNEKIDEEDEDRDLEMDKFEQKYNFRFEEKNSAYLTTHTREKPADSVRRPDEQRKTERQAVAERKELEKTKRKEEINKLKALKREEIIDKLKRTEFIAGNFGANKKFLEKAEKELQTEFIPDLYDKAMDDLFAEKYYQASDDANSDLENNKDIEYQLQNDDFELKKIGLDEGEDEIISDLENSDGEEIDDKKFVKKQRLKKQKAFEENIGKSLKKQVDQKEADEGFDTWYACDGCFQAVGSGQYRFDCQQCDNFCFCEKCYKKNTKHLHKFKRVKVSGDYRPPDNSKELIKKSYMLCSVCDDSLIDLSKRVYYCKECSTDPEAGDMVYWCNKCKETTEHEHKRSKLKSMPGAPKEADTGEADGKEAYLDGLLQEYYDLDCEDIIGGGKVKSRFKYTSVPKENYGLTEEEILLLEDKQLNKLVSMRNLRPYRNLGDDGKPMSEDKLKKIQPNVHRIRKLKQEYKNELEMKRKLVKENQLANLEMEKEKHLGSKERQNKAERKKAKHEKNKKAVQGAMLAKRQAQEQADEENEEEVDQEIEQFENQEDRKSHRKKQKRMAAYGIRE